MDIISNLPVEISHFIMEYLTVKDLGRCLRVCKKWNEIANIDFLWKKHCDNHGIVYEYEVPTFNFEPSPLCFWARMFNKFGNSPAYKWHTNKYDNLSFYKDRCYYKVYTCHKNYFLAYSYKYNNLDVYSIMRCTSGKCNGSKVKLITSIALSLPKTDHSLDQRFDVMLWMTDNFVVVGKCNIIIVFKKVGDANFELYKALKIGFTLQVATRDIKSFVHLNFQGNTYFEILGLIRSSLWVNSMTEDTSFIVNLDSNECKCITSYDTCFTMNNYFVTWPSFEYEEVRVYDRHGNLAVYLIDMICVEDVTINNTVICTQRGVTEHETRIDVWELGKGTELFHLRTNLTTWSKLHPRKEILYILESSLQDEKYIVTSWDIRTNKKMWVLNDIKHLHSTDTYFITQWDVHIVCKNYLIIWPIPSGKDKFACIDARTGKLIYEGTRAHHNTEFNHIDDKYWVQVSRQTFETSVRSYI